MRGDSAGSDPRARPDAGEALQCRLLTRERIATLVETGRIRDVHSLVAWQRFLQACGEAPAAGPAATGGPVL